MRICNSNTLGMLIASSIIRCISILLVFGFVVQCEEVGIGKHVLVNETIIELKDNTRIAENDTDLEQYRKLPGACDVTLDNDGNIILWYSKNSSTTEFGCSIDLVTKNEGQISMEFGISHSGNLSDCITKENQVPDNFISFSYSNKGGEFEELKNGPKTGDDSDCSDKNICIAHGGACRNSTAFYSVGWMPDQSVLTESFTYSLQPVGDVHYIYVMGSMKNETLTLLIKELELRFPEVDVRLEHICYKKEKLQKAEEWQIVDNNFIKDTKNQNFTHLFTFHIMPIKAMRQSMQNFWGDCKNNEPKPGCDKEATLLKCDKMFIKFDKEHFKILVPNVLVAENGTSTDGNKNLSVSTTQNMDTTSELVDTTTANGIEVTKTLPTIDTKMPSATEPSKMSTTTIVFIISGIVVLVFVSIVVVLFCTLSRGKKEEENGQSKQEESQYSNPHSTQSTTNDSTTDSIVDVEMPPTATTEEKTEERTEEKPDFNDVDTVENTQIEPGEPSNAKTGVAVPNSFVDMEEGIGAKHDNDFSVKSDVTVPDTLISTNTVHEDLVVAEDPIIHNAKSGVEVPDSVNED